MKTVIKGALALALLASTAGAALAQEPPANDHDRWHDAGQRPQPRPPGQPQPQRPAAPPQGAPPQAGAPRPQAQPPAQQGPAGQGAWRYGRGGNPGGGPGAVPGQPPQAAPNPGGPRREGGDGPPDRRGDRGDRRDWNDGRGPGPDRRDWNDGRGPGGGPPQQWRGGPGPGPGAYRGGDRPRYDPRNYPREYRSEQRYRGWQYRPPPGFYARRWAYGDILPRLWWTPDYRINSWWTFGLPIPPIGYEWVRVGGDALLIDMYTGRVAEVAYDVFW